MYMLHLFICSSVNGDLSCAICVAIKTSDAVNMDIKFSF
jgi:hypothetical protein